MDAKMLARLKLGESNRMEANLGEGNLAKANQAMREMPSRRA